MSKCPSKAESKNKQYCSSIEYYTAVKMNGDTVTCITTDNSEKQNVEQQKDPGGQIQYDSIHIKFKKLKLKIIL